jgi:hypothetical protein
MSRVVRQRRLWLASALGVMLLVTMACSILDPPPTTATPLPFLSGPTIAATWTVFPSLLERDPVDSRDENAFLGGYDLTAAALPPDYALPPADGNFLPNQVGRQITLLAADGTELNGAFYQPVDQAADAPRRPGLLLLARDGNGWGEWPVQLYDAGFTVLVMNVRGDAPASDFTVMMQSLSTGEADPSRLAVIGGGVGADVALLGCAGEVLCEALVLLSPSNTEPIVAAMAAYSPRPVYLSAAENDGNAFPAVQVLRGVARGPVVVQTYAGGGAGAELIVNQPELGGLISGWLRGLMGL